MELDQLKRIAYVVVPVVCVLVGAAIGWGLKPEQVRVEEKVRVETVEKQVVVEKEVVKVEVVRVTDKQIVDRWHREKTEERRPDGTVATKEVEDRNIDSTIHTDTHSTEVKVVEVEKQVVVEKEVVREVKVEPVLPNWHVGVLAGVAPRFDNLPATAVMVGVEGERRVAGPFWLGAWAMGGSPVTGFSLTNVSGGIKLGVEF